MTKSTTNYRPGDLVLLTYPFTHGGTGKQRPALVVADTGDNDLLLARVTTQSYQSSYDVQLSDWQGAGLLAPSFVRLHKLATIEKSLVKRHLGSAGNADRKIISTALSQLSSGW